MVVDILKYDISPQCKGKKIQKLRVWLTPLGTKGLPGVSCTASLTEMGSALKQLADFVANLEANAVV